MLYLFAILFPCFVCVLFFNLFSRRTRKSPAQKIMLVLVCIALVYTFSDALYLHGFDSNYQMKLITDIVSFVVVPLAPPLMVLMICRLLKVSFAKWQVQVIALLPLIIFCGIVTLISIAGWQQSVAFCQALEGMHMNRILIGLGGVDSLPEGFQHNVFLWQARAYGFAYYSLVVLELFAALFHIAIYMKRRREQPLQAFRFFFMGKESSPFYMLSATCLFFVVITMVRICLGTAYMSSHHWITVIYSLTLSLTLYFMFYLGLIFHVPYFTLMGALRPLLFEQNQGEDTPIRKVALEDDSDNQELKDGSEQNDIPRVYVALNVSLVQLMEDESLFLNPNLTIEDVASELCSNRVYVSRAVNMCQGLTFREYVNKLRIDYAKQYMIEHPDYTQDAIASACGFVDASAFNKKFHQIQGCTPFEWREMGGDL